MYIEWFQRITEVILIQEVLWLLLKVVFKFESALVAKIFIIPTSNSGRTFTRGPLYEPYVLTNGEKNVKVKQ
jgi:hypothetical protein